MFWIAISFFLFAAILLLSRSFYGLSASSSQQQMQELEETANNIKQDRESQTISPSEAESLLRTIATRVLLLQQDQEQQPALSKADRTIFISLAALVIFGSFGLYLFVGSPEFTNSTKTITAQERVNNTDTPRNLEEAIEKLSAHLQSTPEDVESWRLLGWSYQRKNDFDAAKAAYEKALEITPNDPQTLSAYAETLTRAANDIVTETALEFFTQSLKFDPNNVRAKFYTGLAQQQSGDNSGALVTWVELINSSSPDAPWQTDLLERITKLAEKANIPLPKNLGKQQLKGPSAAEITAAEQLTPEQRQQMVQSMVARLQQRLLENPDDLAGWKQLIRSQLVLGQTEQAKISLEQARKIFSQNAPALAELEHFQ